MEALARKKHKIFKWLQYEWCYTKWNTRTRTLALEFIPFVTLKLIHLLSLQSFALFFSISVCCHSKEYTNYLSIDFCRIEIELKIDCTGENGLNCWIYRYDNETQCLCLVIICISYTHAWVFDIFLSSY